MWNGSSSFGRGFVTDAEQPSWAWWFQVKRWTEGPGR